MKAAALSGMPRFYLLALFLLAAAAARAQTPVPLEERPPLGAEITVLPIGALPSSGNLFALFDTIVADVIADRIDTGGTATGAPSRVGAHGSTWTQTTYRVGDADITDPTTTGLPLLMPGVDVWQQVEAATGMMPIDLSAPGMAVTLTPRRPAIGIWTRELELTGSAPPMNAGSSSADPPAINRLNSWAHGNLFLSGPLSPDAPERVGALASITWNRATYFERSGATPLRAGLASAFVNVTGTAARNQIRVIGWGQRTRDAAAHYLPFGEPDAGQQHIAVHTQASWQRAIGSGDGGVRAFAAFTMGHRSTDVAPPSSIVAERLRDGPIPSLLEPGIGTDRTWSIGARVDQGAGGSRHHIVAGADLAGASAGTQSVFAGRVLELLNGMPARVWDFTDPIAESLWSERTVNVFAGDTFAISPRVTVDGGFRFETIMGSAESQPGVVSWRDLLPRAGFHLALLDYGRVAAFGHYGRYAHRLPLADLAYGDPAAPTANIYRAPPGATTALVQGPIVQRLGPGTGGNPAFSSIDPALRRPHMDEMILGFEARPHPSLFLRIAAVGRLERDLINVVDVGVPESAYTVINVPDRGIDEVGSADDQILQFYNRPTSTFGADRYVLTNPPGDDANFVGADILLRLEAGRSSMLLGGTAGRSEGIAANRGFGPLENDTSVPGEAFIDPNALGHAQGRVFTERGYTIKLAVTHQFRGDFTFGMAARYQDGQHFARLVILPGLNQGPEAVRAFRNGRTRFSFTSNLDVRLQKGFSLGSRRLVAILEGFNVFNEYFEYEEATITGATSRQRTAVQPPFAMHVGLRIPF